MNLIAKSITYNGRQLPEKFVLCSFDTLDVMKETYIKQSINRSEITPYRSRVNLYNSIYQEPLQFTMDIIKCNGTEFTNDEYSDMIQWLTASSIYIPLQVTDFEGVTYHKNMEYMAKSTGFDEFIIGNKIIGLRFYFECDAPYGYSLKQEITFTGGESIIINNQTDELSSDIYPVIKIDCFATEEVQIVNQVYSDQILKLKVLEAQSLIIDNESGLIEDNLSMFDFSTDTNLVWIKLAPGINTIDVTGNVNGVIQYRYIRKRGI